MSEAQTTADAGQVADTPAPASTPAPDDVSASSSDAADALPGASSAPTPASDRDNLLAVVRDAVTPKDDANRPAEPAKAADSDPNAPPPAPKAADADAEPTELEQQAYKPSARKFIAKLSRQRTEAQDALRAVEPELAAHRQLTGYLRQHQLAADDVNALLGVGAALRRGDMQAFLDGIQPYRELALQSLGKSVSPDLQRQVDEGAISPEAAAELTRTRMDASRARTELQVQQQSTAARDAQEVARAKYSAVEAWEQGIRARDPDYALKETMIRRTSQALLAELGAPRTPQDAAALAQRAYDEVTATMARTRPVAQATRQTPAGVSTPSLGAAPEPRSLKEAVMLGLQRARAGA